MSCDEDVVSMAGPCPASDVYKRQVHGWAVSCVLCCCHWVVSDMCLAQNNKKKGTLLCCIGHHVGTVFVSEMRRTPRHATPLLCPCFLDLCMCAWGFLCNNVHL